jgi:hypothetical protein
MKKAGGWSQAKHRLGEAAAILRISRRQKALYGGLFWKLKILSVPGLEVTTLPYSADVPKFPQHRSDTYAGTREWLSVLRANDTGGPIILWGDVRRVRE